MGFEHSGVKDMVSYEEFKEKGYYVVPTDPDWDKYPTGLKNFHDDPDNHPLKTPSGKVEFYSQNLAKHFPDDQERPPVPHWIEKGESHDEALSSERAAKYPLLVLSNHPRWRCHANHDDLTWLREIETCKVQGADGYKYEPLWINPVDAAARGIAAGDVVKIYNERGAVLAGAYVTERVMPGAVYIDHGARYDPIVPGELDRGGAINTLTPHNLTSKNATGMVEQRLPGRGRTRRHGRAEEAVSGGLQPAVPRRSRALSGTGVGRIYRGGCLMGKVMVIDLAICNGCHNCQIACKDEHVVNDWSPIAKPQPDTGQFWNKVINMERGTVPKVQVTYHHSICQHCEDAPCITACNAHAIYRRPDGIVIIDPEKCRGNKMCLAACPYENVIYFNDDLNIAQKCTFCAHLIDRGWTETRCSDACPTGAFTFGEEEDPAIKDKIAQAQFLKPELPTRPRVYYLNLPQKWIAGALYDHESRRVHRGGDRHRHQPGDRSHRVCHHRQLRGLLAQGSRRRHLHHPHREGGLPGQEAGAHRRHGCRPEPGGYRALEGVSEPAAFGTPGRTRDCHCGAVNRVAWYLSALDERPLEQQRAGNGSDPG